MANRREFLKISSLASVAFLTPGFIQKLVANRPSFAGKRLVVVQLSGGNDGLNTLIPYADDRYYQARPRLGIADTEVLKLTDTLAMNPAMGSLRNLYDQGWLSILTDVGYPNPDRSHFRAMDIWHSGSPSDEYWETGWLGRYLDAACANGAPAHEVLELDESLSLAVKGKTYKALAMRDPERLMRITRSPEVLSLSSAYQSRQQDAPEDLAYLYKTLTQTLQSSDYLQEKLKSKPALGDFPDTGFGKQLRTTASLIGSGFEASVYYVSLSGFDTHVNQRGIQERLLKEYSDGMEAFVKNLQQMNLWSDTLILTFSEFGRRVDQNASGGTDHGKANCLWVLGDKLHQPGVVNGPPQLSKLDDGDLSFRLDFREVYGSVLRDWLKADDQQILKGNFSGIRLV